MGGGQTNPVTGEPSLIERRELFISYSHKDQAFLEQFWIHLSSLANYGLKHWDDSKIKPGDIWLEEIEQALARAQVALLLVSPDFLASTFIQRKELPTLFDAAKKDGLTILWLPIRPCSWKRYPQIAQYQSVGSLEPTLAEMKEAERDRAMVEITDYIDDEFKRILQERQTAEQEADADVLPLRQEEERQLEDLESKRQAEETGLNERLKAKNEARVETERWRAEVERLARENEELQRQATFKMPWQTSQPEIRVSQCPPLIPISTTHGWLVGEGKEWRKHEKAITVTGYREELAMGVAITMIQIPEGQFLMGSPTDESESNSDERPQHKVSLRTYFLGQTPVTQAQWQLVARWEKVERDLKLSPSRFSGANRPVEKVSWYEAIEFCRRLSLRTGRKYVLPSEAQWEYACRAGTTTPFAFGDALTPEMANYAGNCTYGTGPKGLCRQQTTEVCGFPANRWGLHDMHGNVSEWCADPWHKLYDGAPADGSVWSLGGDDAKLLRGGSWGNDPRNCRSAYRRGFFPVLRDICVGFRVCMPPPGLIIYP